MKKTKLFLIVWAITVSVCILQMFDGSARAQKTSTADTNGPDQPQLVVQLGHSSNVDSIAYSPDGRYVLSGSLDGTARLWEAETGREIRAFRGHIWGVTAVVFSPDGRFALTGSSDETARLWDLMTGKEMHVFTNGTLVKSAAFSLDGSFVLTNSLHGACLWDVKTGEAIRNFGEGAINAVAYSPDGRFILTGGEDHAAMLWDAATGQIVRQYKGHSESVNAVSFSPDGRFVLTGSDDGSARLWDANTGQELKLFLNALGMSSYEHLEQSLELMPEKYTVELRQSLKSLPEAAQSVLEDRDRNRKITSVAFSSDGRLALTGSYAAVDVWDTTTGKGIRTFGTDAYLNPLYEKSKEFFRLSNKLNLNTDEMVLQSIGVEITWDNIKAKVSRNFLSGHKTNPDAEEFMRLGDEIVTESTKDIYHSWALFPEQAAFSPDGRFILTKSSDAAVLLDAETGKVVQRFGGLSGEVRSTALSYDGRFVLTGVTLISSGLWDVTTGQEIRRYEKLSLSSPIFSPDGRFLLANETATGTGKIFAGVVGLYEIATGKVMQRFEGHDHMIVAIAFSRDGRFVLTGSWDKTTRLWDAETGQEIRRFEGHTDQVNAVAFSPDGHLLVTGSNDGTAWLWNVATGGKIQRFQADSTGVTAVQFSQDGHYILTGGYDSSIRKWDIVTGEEIQRFTGHLSNITSITFSRDGRFVLTGSWDKTARLWDAETGQEIRRFEGHTDQVNAVAFSPDGRIIFTGSNDATTRLWETSSGKELCRLISFRNGDWVVVNAEGRFDTNNLEEIHGLHWIMPDDPMKPLPVEIFMRDYYEPRLLPRILNGEQFQPVRRAFELNRIQPHVKIVSIEQQTDHPDAVTVMVEVTKGKDALKRGAEKITRETSVYDVRLFRDGQLVAQMPKTDAVLKTVAKRGATRDLENLDIWRQSTHIALDTTGKHIIRFENIQLPRRAGIKQVQFSAYAFNEDRIKSATDRMSYDLPKGFPAVKGRAYVIAVGVNASENPKWNLSVAANDARLFRTTLVEHLSQTGAFDEVVPVMLISDYNPADGQVIETSATKENFNEVLELLSGKKQKPVLLKDMLNADQIRQAKPEDLVFISFSSHGIYKNRNFYLLPYDIGSGTMNFNMIFNRSISSEELSIWLRDVDAGEMVMIVDACESAATIETAGFKPGPMGSRGLGQLAYDKGMRILAATQVDAPALEGNGLEHGFLTYALICDGIEARQADYKPNDGRIALVEWLGYGVERVPKLHAEVATGQVQQLRLTACGVGQRHIVLRLRGEDQDVHLVQQPALFDFARKKQELILVEEKPPDQRRD